LTSGPAMALEATASHITCHRTVLPHQATFPTAIRHRCLTSTLPSPALHKAHNFTLPLPARVPPTATRSRQRTTPTSRKQMPRRARCLLSRESRTMRTALAMMDSHKDVMRVLQCGGRRRAYKKALEVAIRCLGPSLRPHPGPVHRQHRLPSDGRTRQPSLGKGRKGHPCPRGVPVGLALLAEVLRTDQLLLV